MQLLWVMVALAAVGWATVIALLMILPARQRRTAIRRCLRVQSEIEPYLRRRAEELELELPERRSCTDPEGVLDSACGLARQLTERERSQVALGDTVNLAISDTMPSDSNRGDGPSPG